MILINYPNLIRVGEKNLIIIIRLIFISLQGKLKVTEVTKYFSQKRENIERKKQEDFLRFFKYSIKVLK